ncbi:LLM class flavin-dependent oxidoreductase [Corticibacter populi]|nr:LLM class flavin-dependent oxidoreductase [Corticibacter populi]RZS36063.1 alkanesulfonate monooxygenase SsuD/methylene tetrahydromethanopterin reductase-like flavin-dependent oxidoreductase (luciferase family) [Corticibacter populi]
MKQLHLNLVWGDAGMGAWQAPTAISSYTNGPAAWRELAQTAEHACLDAILCTDRNHLAATRTGSALFGLEPFTTCAVLAAHTNRIGLIATAATPTAQPYNIARRLASLDHISQGRAGWDIRAALPAETLAQYGKTVDPQTCCDPARTLEFVQVTRQLWDSWGDHALQCDGTGQAAVDGSQNHAIEHQGRWFSVQGPLDVPRPPQGQPLLSHAVRTAQDETLAASHADLVFVRPNDPAQAAVFRRKMRARCAAAGRTPDSIRVMGALRFVLASSDAAAAERANALAPYAAAARRPSDAPSADSPLTYVGTPTGLAARMQTWLEAEAVDGFNLICPWLPGGLEQFAHEVIPLLQQRGIFRTHYANATLRSHFGLPTRRYAALPSMASSTP